MIGAEVNRIVYKGDGITTSFPYTFTVLEKADIVVTLVDKESKKKTLTSDYFIDMDKKEITYPGYAPGEEPAEAERPPVLPEGWYLVIQRKTKIDQQTSLGDKWPFDVTEDALDKITRILQDLDTDSKRHLEVSVEASGIDPMLPSPKANMGFYWDETGTKLVEGLNPNAASESAAASASAAATSETNAAASANTAKSWSMSDSSPDGIIGNKSSKTWAEEAKTSASNSANSASASESSAETAAYYADKAMGYAEAPLGQAPNGSKSARVWAEIAGSKAGASASSASASASSASDASTSASNAKISETNAANSATSAAESAEKAKAYIATTYSKAEVDAKIPTKTSQLTNDSEFVDTDTLVGSEQNLIAMIPTKTSQLTNDAGYITKADITEGSTPDLTPYMKKYADSDLMMGVYKLIFGRTVISDDFRNTVPMFTIDATEGRGVNIKGPSVLVNGSPIATETDLSGKLDKTGTAAAATKATQDGAGNVIETTYIKTINNLKPDISGNVNISGGTNITVDTVLSVNSANAIANKAVYNALRGKLGVADTAEYAKRDSAGNVIVDTYANKADISGVVKSVNGTTPDSNGNVNISAGGGDGVSTSVANTWTAQQNFQSLKFNFESFATSRISGTYDSPDRSVATYNVTGALTLDMSTLVGMISNGDTSIFTAYIASNGSYALSITNAGTLKYAGNASDLAITASGLLLNIFLTKNTSGVVTSIAQATKLS